MKKIFQFREISKVLQFFVSLFVFLLPWQTIYIYREQLLNEEKFQYGTLGWYGIEIILWPMIFLFMLWYRKQLQEKNSHPEFSFTAERKFILCILFFLLVALLSFLWAPDPAIAEQHAFHILEASLLFLVVLVGPLNLKKIMQWFIAGAVVQSLLGIYQFVTQSTFASKWLGLVSHPVAQTGTSVIQSAETGRWLRAYGAFAHPNIFGGYLAVSLVFTVLLFLTDSRKKISLQWGWYILFGIQWIALFFTFSRSAWLAVALGGIGLLWGNWKRMMKLGVFLLFLTMVLSGVYFPLLKTRAAVQAPHETRSVEERKEGPLLAYALWKESWLTGVGAGNYTQALVRRFPSISPALVQPVHMVPVLILTELGVLGMLFLGGAVFFFVRLKKGKNLIVPVLFLTPLFFLDHYLYSFAVGLFLLAVFVAVTTRFLSTVYPQIPPGQKNSS